MGWRKKSSRSKTSWVKKAVTGLSSSLDQFEIIRHEAHERRGTDSTKRTKRYVCAYVTAVDEEGAKKDAGMGTLNALSIFDALS